MKLLVIADMHGESVENIEKFLADKYDFLIIAGDITQFGPPSRAGEFLDGLGDVKVPVLAIPGNCDPEEVVGVLEEKDVNLHSKSKERESLTFVGLGASNVTPFNTPFELSEEEIKDKLNALAQRVGGDWVLVTHAPPYDTKADLTSSGTHAGSESIRKIIEDKQPLVNFCAHIHEARSVDKIGRTKIVNPGPFSEGYAVEAVIDEGVEVNMLQV